MYRRAPHVFPHALARPFARRPRCNRLYATRIPSTRTSIGFTVFALAGLATGHWPMMAFAGSLAVLVLLLGLRQGRQCLAFSHEAVIVRYGLLRTRLALIPYAVIRRIHVRKKRFEWLFRIGSITFEIDTRDGTVATTQAFGPYRNAPLIARELEQKAHTVRADHHLRDPLAAN